MAQKKRAVGYSVKKVRDISQGNVATRHVWDVVESLVMTLLQIYCRVSALKEFWKSTSLWWTCSVKLFWHFFDSERPSAWFFYDIL